MGGFSMGDLAIGRIVMTAAFAGPGTSDHRPLMVRRQPLVKSWTSPSA
jgi:hypothetical protein